MLLKKFTRRKRNLLPLTIKLLFMYCLFHTRILLVVLSVLLLVGAGGLAVGYWAFVGSYWAFVGG